MNTGSIGRSMNRMITQLRNPDQMMPAANSTYPKGGVSCSKDSLVVNQTLVFQIKVCGKSPALRVAAKPLAATRDDFANMKYLHETNRQKVNERPRQNKNI